MIKNRANLIWSLCALAFAVLLFAGGIRGAWITWLVIAAVSFYRAIKPGPPPIQREQLRTIPAGKGYLVGSTSLVAIFLGLPLWREFYEPAQPLWNVFLMTFLVAVVVGVFLGVRYLQKNRIEIGEGRLASGDAHAP